MILIEDSDTYKGKTAGPRIRTLVQDPTTLPSYLTLIGSDGVVKQKIKVLYSGLHNQCNRCRGFGHYARDCKQNQNQNQERHQDKHDEEIDKAPIEQEQPFHCVQKRPNKGFQSRRQGSYLEEGKKTNKSAREVAKHSMLHRKNLDSTNKGHQMTESVRDQAEQVTKSGDQDLRKNQTYWSKGR